MADVVRTRAVSQSVTARERASVNTAILETVSSASVSTTISHLQLEIAYVRCNEIRRLCA